MIALAAGVRFPATTGVSFQTKSTTGFRGVLPRRWAVERTFSWLGQSRRLSKDYERLCETSEALVYLTMSRIMLKRLARG